jgi:hypothetical protein
MPTTNTAISKSDMIVIINLMNYYSQAFYRSIFFCLGMGAPFYLREDLVQRQVKSHQLRIKQLQATSLLLL